MQLGERLREERERLGFNQSDFAALAGVTRKTQFNYESGARSPDAAYLETVMRAGADILYILTGQRAPQQLLAAEPPAPYCAQPLAPDEAALLDNYRHSPPEAQAALRATSAALAQHQAITPAKGKGKS